MGNTELAQTLTQELNKKRESLMNFKKAISTYTQQMAARQQNQNQHQGSSPASAPSSSSSFNTTTTGNANLAHHHRSISGSQHPAVAVKPMPNQDSLLPNRMPMEQNKLSPHPAGSNVMGLNGSSNISPMQSEMMSGVASASGQSQAVNPQTGAPAPQMVWKGLLKWSGQSQQGKKDMHTFVGASSQTPQRWCALSLFSCCTILTLVYCKSSKYLASNACSIANIGCSNASTPRLDENPCTRTLHVSPRHSSCPEI
jgi:mediator of RNA polymerase II transcription subunit 25